jgi:hypothetical protein
MRISFKIIVLLIFVCVSSIAGRGAAEYIVKSSKAPVIDGVLNDDCWKKASFKQFSAKVKAGKKVDAEIVEESQAVKNNSDKRRSEFAMTFNSQGLYVAVRCMESDLKGLSTKCEMPDGLFEYFRKNDMVELFLGQKASGRYYWFRVNPEGVKTDLYVRSGCDRSWNGVWKVAAGREKNAWTVEMFLPFCGFNRLPFGDLDVFSVARYCPNKNVRSVYGGKYRKVNTWPQLSLKNYSRIAAKSPFNLKGLEIAEGATDNVGWINASVINKSNKTQIVTPEFRIMRPSIARGYFPHANGPRSLAKGESIVLKPGTVENISNRISIGSDEVAIIQLLLKNKQGDVVFASRDYGLRVKHTIAGPGPEYSYYTKEKDARLRFFISKTGKDMRLKMTLSAQGKSILTHDLKADKEVINDVIAVADIPLGKNTLSLELLKDSKRVASRKFELVKLQPNLKGNEVKIRRWSKSISVDGKDFVPIGNSPMVPHHGLKYGQMMMREMAKNNFNAMHLWGGYVKRDKRNKMPKTVKFDFEKLHKCFDGAAQNKLKVIISIGMLVGHNPKSPFIKWRSLTDAERIALVKELVMQIKDRKELLSYEIFDEPGFFESPEWLERIYHVIKEIDPYHLVTVNNCRGARAVLPYVNASDIVGIDYYPIGKEPAGAVAPLTDELVHFADWKPVKWWIQGYKIFNPEAPTPAEIKAMTYMTAAHGATSFFYFIGKPRVELWQAQGESAKELRYITEAITADYSKQLKLQPVKSTVYASYRRNNNKHWIIAVNESSAKQQVSIRLPESLRGKNLQIERVFDKQPVVYSNGNIKANFAPLERQVFEINVK